MHASRDDLEVLHGRESTQVEEVATRAEVASLRPLAVGEMRKAVLNADALAQLSSASARADAQAQLLLQLVLAPLQPQPLLYLQPPLL